MVVCMNNAKKKGVSTDVFVESLTSSLSKIEEFLSTFKKKKKTSLKHFLDAKPSSQTLDQLKYELLSDVYLIAGCYQLAIDSVACI